MPNRDQDAVSLAEKFRRELIDDRQGALFPDELRYLGYLRYCSLIHIPPMTLDRWHEVYQQVWGRFSV